MTTAEQQPSEQSSLLFLLRTLRRRIGVLTLCALTVPGAAFAFSVTQEKQYSASASLLFRDPRFDQTLFGSSFLAPSTDPAREAATNERLVSLRVVADRTARALRSVLTSRQIQDKVSVESRGQSDVVSITATDPSPELAARLANAYGEQYIRFRREADRSKIREAQELIERQLRSLDQREAAGPKGRSLSERAEELEVLASLQTGNAELVQQAEPPSSPSSPKPLRNTLIGGVLGLLLGTGLALLFERVDRRLKDAGEIGEVFERPVLGAIPDSRAIAKSDREPEPLGAPEAEAFRMLRANLRYFNVDREIRSVVITSAAPAEGKSTVALNLATAAAKAGGSVLLLEADLRHPALGARLGISSERGLSHLLSGGDPAVKRAVDTVTVAGRRQGDHGFRTMDVLTSGPLPPNPSDLIESDRMKELIRAAEGEYDLVIIDTPPTSVVSDAIPLVSQVSGVIVVCRLGRTTRESATHLREQLENLEAHTLGVVANSVDRPSQYGYYRYGGGKRRGRSKSYLTPPPSRDPGNGGVAGDTEDDRADEASRAAPVVVAGAEPAPSLEAGTLPGKATQAAPFFTRIIGRRKRRRASEK